MNQKNLSDIFEHYIEKFEYINNAEHYEVYKWQIAQQFRPLMDAALDSSDEELSEKLYEAKKLSANIIDSYLQPFYGLVKAAEKEPEVVRAMFVDLFQDDGGDLKARQERIHSFLNASHALRDKYYKDSFLYTDDFHSVTSYLTLYDPDHNYILKQNQSHKFAECVEFYEDWGTGENVNLGTYYKMCDELVDAILQDEALLKTDATRFDPKLGYGELYPDKAKHLLAFDMIYCSSVYNLYSGVSIVKRNAKERILYEERKKEAKERKEFLDAAYAQREEYESLCDFLASAFSVGSIVKHSKLGIGEVLETKDGNITVRFDRTEKTTKLGLPMSIGKGLIDLVDGQISVDDEQKLLLLEGNKILDRVQSAEKSFAPYADDLG